MYIKPILRIITKDDLLAIMIKATSGPCRASGTCVGLINKGCVALPQQEI